MNRISNDLKKIYIYICITFRGKVFLELLVSGQRKIELEAELITQERDCASNHFWFRFHIFIWILLPPSTLSEVLIFRRNAHFIQENRMCVYIGSFLFGYFFPFYFILFLCLKQNQKLEQDEEIASVLYHICSEHNKSVSLLKLKRVRQAFRSLTTHFLCLKSSLLSVSYASNGNLKGSNFTSLYRGESTFSEKGVLTSELDMKT